MGQGSGRPVIGIAPSIGDGKIKMSTAYAESVFRAGGIPFFLPYTTDGAVIAEYAKLDGFLFAGGVDLDPALYGEEKLNDTVEIDPARDAFEMALFAAVYPTGKPIFGICRGIQSINVALGGTLYQDIPAHRQSEPGRVGTHAVRFEGGTRIRRIMGGEEIVANTFHHQAIKTPAPSLSVVGRACDEAGTIEAVEAVDAGRFLLAVQWHPELLAASDPAHAALFAAFIEAAGHC